MSGFFVRTAGERDLAAVGALLAETWHATYDAIYGFERVAEITASWHTAEELRPRLNRPSSEFLVADDGAELAAMAYAAASGKGRTVILHQLYVRPSRQGLGIGRDLLQEVEACFPLVDRIRVEVEEANSAAAVFFRRRGFVAMGSGCACAADASAVPAILYEKPVG